MVTTSDNTVIGEIQCLNCGRILGEATRAEDGGAWRLRPAANQGTLLARVVDGRSLRCMRCNGRAFIEPTLPSSPAVATEQRASVDPLLGAA